MERAINERDRPMTSMRVAAERFFVACDTGKGWQACEQYCHPGATFSAQADYLDGMETLKAYVEFMKGLFALLPDGKPEVRLLAVDETRKNVAVCGIFHATHTGEGGPVPPTGKSTNADYVYVMDFDDDKIRHVTKIWNDGITMRQLGWT
ncbi:ester cyclase [Pseudonocardia sp. CA-142604]|uniref:ester cyclase n=1 Tax=Pseudonocardia sp. CA-142604 TaxID=3240024 RepID=UPI003D94C486